jgi:diguanylate cyclase (GGDEF)-like protein
LRTLLREHDTACRLGGDEFLLLLPDITASTPVTDDQPPAAGAGTTIPATGHQLSSSASIGVSLYPVDGQDFTTLMKKADTAMYHAKDAGRNTCRLFDADMQVEAEEALRLRSRFMLALETGQFVLHYQPQ